MGKVSVEVSKTAEVQGQKQKVTRSHKTRRISVVYPELIPYTVIYSVAVNDCAQKGSSRSNVGSSLA